MEQFAIYSRKSKFTGRGESVENQVAMCRQYLALQFGQQAADAARVFEDEGFSGGTLDRPQFQKMMQQLQQGGYRGVVVYRLDRISRNIGDFANLIRQLQGNQVDFISIREQFDTSCPMGRAMMYISSVFSQLERETIAERIRDNMLQLAKTGRWLGGTTPTGYRSRRVADTNAAGKTKAAYILEEIPEEIDRVAVIYETFLRTASLTQTETWLLQQGYQSKTGRSYTRFSIRGILTNPVYVVADEAAFDYLSQQGVQMFAQRTSFSGAFGVMVYNRTLQVPGKTQKLRPMEEWICAIGRHRGVIPGRMWAAVQQLLAQNSSKCYRKPRSNTALLSGLIQCGACGSFMRPKVGSKTAATGQRRYGYLCTQKERSKGVCCQMVNVNGQALDAAVLQAVAELPVDPALLAQQLGVTWAQAQEIPGAPALQPAQVQRLCKDKENKIQSLVRSLERAGQTDAARDYILGQINQLHGQITQLQQPKQPPALLGTQTVQEFCSVAAVLNAMEPVQQRQLLRRLIRRVIWDGRQAHVFFFGASDPQAKAPAGEKQPPAAPTPLREDSK